MLVIGPPPVVSVQAPGAGPGSAVTSVPPPCFLHPIRSQLPLVLNTFPQPFCLELGGADTIHPLQSPQILLLVSEYLLGVAAQLTDVISGRVTAGVASVVTGKEGILISSVVRRHVCLRWMPSPKRPSGDSGTWCACHSRVLRLLSLCELLPAPRGQHVVVTDRLPLPHSPASSFEVKLGSPRFRTKTARGAGPTVPLWMHRRTNGRPPSTSLGPRTAGRSDKSIKPTWPAHK